MRTMVAVGPAGVPAVGAATQATPATPTTPFAVPNRSTYDAKQSEFPKGGLGDLVRKEGQGATGDAAVDAAHDNAGIVHAFLTEVLGRNSTDGKGMALKSVVHFGSKYNNAFWDGEKMTYGDGDGKLFTPLSGALDVVAHELFHGVTEHTAGLAYRNQSGALNESWSDVLGELVEIWHENRGGFGSPDALKGAEWLMGEDVFTPGTSGDALRSMKNPGTGYKGDPQPGHMKDYKKMSGDNGGVHVNSGIPNKAAYEAGIRIGGDKLAKIWYKALTDYLKPNSDFNAAAAATLAAAQQLYGTGDVSQAIIDAWQAVGITAKAGASVVGPGARVAFGGGGHFHGGVVPDFLLDGKVERSELV